MGDYLHLNQGLHGKPKLRQIKARAVAYDEPLGLQPSAASGALAGREVQTHCQLLRGAVCTALDFGLEFGVNGVQGARPLRFPPERCAKHTG
jgi:hypothetical protein